MKLYHYTTVGKFSKIWEGKCLKFSMYDRTNDIFEKYKFVQIDSVTVDTNYMSSVNYKSFKKHFLKILLDYKQISLCAYYGKEHIGGNASPMMWGQYASNSKGVCIEIDTEKIKIDPQCVWIGKVRYGKVPIIKFDNCTFTSDADLHKFISKHRKSIFFKKHRHWEHENEYRMISNQVDFLLIKNAITAVYVPDNKGYAFREVRRRLKGSGVKLCCMHPTCSANGECKIQFIVE
jgi:hypothetical protein